MSNKTSLHPVDADKLVFSNLLIRKIIGKAQDSNLCVSRYRHKTVKWILVRFAVFLFGPNCEIFKTVFQNGPSDSY